MILVLKEQIACELKQAETATPAVEVLRRMGISEQTFYRWKKLYGGLGEGELRRLKQLEDENRKLKHLAADLSLDKHVLQDLLSKKSEACSAARDRPVCPELRGTDSEIPVFALTGIHHQMTGAHPAP